MISSTGASADSVFVLDLRFSNFDQLNHAARRTRERSLRGMLNLAIFAIRVRSTQLQPINNDSFTPDNDSCAAYFATAGAMPVGAAVWQYHDGKQWLNRELTVAELTVAEVAASR